MKKLEWSSVVLLVAIAVCAAASPVAFFALVPERIIDKLFGLPWTTVLAVGAPALAAAILVVRQAWVKPIVKTLLLLAFVSTVQGCGSVVPVYSTTLADCIARERAIIDRQGSTEEADREAMRLERVRCDEALRVASGGQ